VGNKIRENIWYKVLTIKGLDLGIGKTQRNTRQGAQSIIGDKNALVFSIC
jgi:hypothetical protein